MESTEKETIRNLGTYSSFWGGLRAFYDLVGFFTCFCAFPWLKGYSEDPVFLPRTYKGSDGHQDCTVG